MKTQVLSKTLLRDRLSDFEALRSGGYQFPHGTNYYTSIFNLAINECSSARNREPGTINILAEQDFAEAVLRVAHRTQGYDRLEVMSDAELAQAIAITSMLLRHIRDIKRSDADSFDNMSVDLAYKEIDTAISDARRYKSQYLRQLNA